MKTINRYINLIMDFIEGVAEKISDISLFNINPGKKTIAIVFIGAVTLIASVSGIMVIGELSADDPTLTSDEIQTTEQALSFVSDNQTLCGNFLFALTYEEKISLLVVLRADSADKSVKAAFLSGDTYCCFNNLSGTMNEHYKNGGVTELLWAVGEYANISIERYFVADSSDFSAILDHIGEITVDLEHDVVCGQDAASFIIEEGHQTLIPAMMAKYFYYLCDNQPTYNEEIIETMAIYGKKLFCSGNEEDTKNNFDYMISCIDTNVSALDFNNYKASILSLASEQVLDSIIVEEDVSTFK